MAAKKKYYLFLRSVWPPLMYRPCTDSKHAANKLPCKVLMKLVHCCLCLAFDCKGHVTSCSGSSISYLHAKFEQNWSINTKVTFKGRCGLCLAFDCKGHVTSRSRLSISYLHAKFEQNRSINSRDMVFLIFQGCLAFKRVLRTLVEF